MTEPLVGVPAAKAQPPEPRRTTMDQAFMRDAVELAIERVTRGELDRRMFVRGLALLGLGAAVAPGLAEAQKPKGNVLVNRGGDAPKHFYDAWGKPYETD